MLKSFGAIRAHSFTTYCRRCALHETVDTRIPDMRAVAAVHRKRSSSPSAWTFWRRFCAIACCRRKCCSNGSPPSVERSTRRCTSKSHGTSWRNCLERIVAIRRFCSCATFCIIRAVRTMPSCVAPYFTLIWGCGARPARMFRCSSLRRHRFCRASWQYVQSVILSFIDCEYLLNSGWFNVAGTEESTSHCHIWGDYRCKAAADRVRPRLDWTIVGRSVRNLAHNRQQHFDLR